MGHSGTTTLYPYTGAPIGRTRLDDIIDLDAAETRARAAEAKLATISRTRRPTDEESREAQDAYAGAAAAVEQAKKVGVL